MGTFLSMTSVVGKTEAEVVKSVSKYVKTVGGGLEKEALPIDDNNCCVIEEARGNTTLHYPIAYLEWDNTSAFLSRDLQAPVFSFHIHDGDFWTYVLFANGEAIDQFNPIPDYWDENIGEEELERWKGSATTVAACVNTVAPAAIERYLIRWDPDADEDKKAYAGDEFAQEDWQLLDFMQKLGLPYPRTDDGRPKGETFRLWTKGLPLKQQTTQIAKQIAATEGRNSSKPWWKLW